MPALEHANLEAAAATICAPRRNDHTIRAEKYPPVPKDHILVDTFKDDNHDIIVLLITPSGSLGRWLFCGCTGAVLESRSVGYSP